MSGAPRTIPVAEEIAAELPGLAVWELSVPGGPGRPLEGVRERLRHLSRRMNGAEAVALRTRPVPHAYRVLFRHLGLDPDRQRPPGEEVVLERLLKGEYASADRVGDALTVAVAETQVPLWAFDEERLEGDLVLRAAGGDERLGDGPYAHELPGGRIVLADARGPLAVLFGRLAAERLPQRSTRRLRLVAVQAPGVPQIHVEEAMWTCVECLVEG